MNKDVCLHLAIHLKYSRQKELLQKELLFYSFLQCDNSLKWYTIHIT